ncbi:SLC13 family permease [Kocuria turfanensis]|uniref:Sodium-dependent dicarboxylate transporter SdcS n=1 Tax=Kocuria turfanensis TaxID=388357 RepID=A0A512IG04_9MICC|nr:DASS family sodium-coupled anion symporter [Kocuria turfanensis]GEO96590.1 carboxylate transporter [Kocuria turfanensis]
MSDRPPIPGAHLKDHHGTSRGGGGADLLSPGEQAPAERRKTHRVRWTGLVAGLALSLSVYAVLPADLAHPAKLTAATAVLMGVWWMTEAIPIPATALLPLIIFPVLGEDVAVDDVGASYGSNIIFLFMGGFLLALAMQRWNLHRRIALRTVRVMGTKPTRMVAGFMVATAFLSMWVSNTATAVMMLPIGVSVLLLLPNLLGASGPGSDSAEEGALHDAELEGADPQSAEAKEAVIASDFGTALMLGIAYAASIGSLSTIIGTPPNTLMVGYLQEAHGITVGFGQWMLVGVPLSVVMLGIAWFLLTKVLFRPEIDEIPGGRKLIDGELRKLGPMSTGEKLVLAVFVLAALSWVLVPVLFEDPPISDAGIAMVVGLLLFLLPAGARRGVRLLDWETAVKLPWGVLLLFGGGLALSSQFSSSGLTDWIGEGATALGTVPVVLLVAILAAGILFLTELTSNTATAATFLPVSGGVALGLGLDPMLLAVPVALAATCAFMLPVATPPNAIAFGSGYVTIGQMLRGGLWLNLIGIALITLVTTTLATWVFSIVY